jgi:hypothetical protein
VGGVYTPLKEIEPAPVAGLTVHIAIWFEVPEMAALYATRVPALADVGPVTVTLVADCPWLLSAIPHAVNSSRSARPDGRPNDCVQTRFIRSLPRAAACGEGEAIPLGYQPFVLTGIRLQIQGRNPSNHRAESAHSKDRVFTSGASSCRRRSQMECCTVCNRKRGVMHYHFSGSQSHAHHADVARFMLMQSISAALRAIRNSRLSIVFTTLPKISRP